MPRRVDQPVPPPGNVTCCGAAACVCSVTGGPTEPGGTTPPPPPLVPLLVAPAFEHRPHQGHRVRELPYPHHRCGRPAGRSVGPPQYAPPYRRSPTSLAAPLNPSAPNPPPPPLVPPRPTEPGGTKPPPPPLASLLVAAAFGCDRRRRRGRSRRLMRLRSRRPSPFCSGHRFWEHESHAWKGSGQPHGPGGGPFGAKATGILSLKRAAGIYTSRASFLCLGQQCISGGRGYFECVLSTAS